jgi:hypothetical protein
VVPGPTPPTFATAIRRRAPAAKVPGAPHDVTNAPSVSPGARQQGALLTSIDAPPACPSPHATIDAPSSATLCTAPSSTVPPAGHHMLTQFKTGHLQPNRKYAYNADVQQLPVAPSSMRMTLRDPAWHATMQEEFNAPQANNMGSHVPRPPPLASMLSLASGCSRTNFFPTDHWIGARPGGSSAASSNVSAWTLIRRSRLWSNWHPYALCFTSQLHATSRCTSWT